MLAITFPALQGAQKQHLVDQVYASLDYVQDPGRRRPF